MGEVKFSTHIILCMFLNFIHCVKCGTFSLDINEARNYIEIYNGILREGMIVTSKASLFGTKLLIDIKEDFENLAQAFYEADLTKDRKIKASCFRIVNRL